MAVGEVHKADIAERWQLIELLGRGHVTRQNLFLAQSHTARTGHCQHLQKFTTPDTHTNIP